MQWIILAALCSVWVSILLKQAKQRGFEPLILITWNYALASILCWFWFQPDFRQMVWSEIPWWLVISLSILLPSLFWLLSKSLQTAGLIKTELAQRLSVVLTLIAAYGIYQQQFNWLKILAIVMGIAAVILMIACKSDSERSSVHALRYLLAVWVGYAVVDILLKYMTHLGFKLAVVLNLTFVGAFILCLGLVLVKQRTAFKAPRHIGVGLALGALNFANIALYVQAHLSLKDNPAVVFAGMNILVVVLGVIFGRYLLKEPLSNPTKMGLCLGIISLVCLALTM